MSALDDFEDAARAVLWFHTSGHPDGVEPGGFVKSLLGTFQLADIENTKKLSSLWPEIGLADIIYKTHDLDGIEDFLAKYDNNTIALIALAHEAVNEYEAVNA